VGRIMIRGLVSPILLQVSMIQSEFIKNLIKENLEDTGIFVVELNVTTSNKITVSIDHMDGIGIDDCIAISRKIEHSLDREVEDFELMVSSYGLDQPFKLVTQYQKNLGREVEVLDENSKKIEGILLEVKDNSFKIGVETKEKIEGTKKKQIVNKEYIFNYDNIKSTKLKISFK